MSNLANDNKTNRARLFLSLAVNFFWQILFIINSRDPNYIRVNKHQQVFFNLMKTSKNSVLFLFVFLIIWVYNQYEDRFKGLFHTSPKEELNL